MREKLEKEKIRLEMEERDKEKHREMEREKLEHDSDYDKVKQLILNAYELIPEAYRGINLEIMGKNLARLM